MTLISQNKVWFYFICSFLLPYKHLSKLREKGVVLLYAILMGYKLIVGKLI